MNRKFSTSDCIFNLLVQTAKTGTHHWKNTISDLGVTAVQAKVLALLCETGAVSASDLGSAACIDNATMTGILDRLQALGIVTRHHNPNDRRAIIISLTEPGKELATEIYSRVEPANKKFLENLSEAEVLLLKELLRRL
ncbi:MAG: MarR family transcriptional regulator [Neptuniibacter sp.]